MRPKGTAQQLEDRRRRELVLLEQGLGVQQVADRIDGPLACGFNTALWNCPRAAQLIRKRFGASYHVDHRSRCASSASCRRSPNASLPNICSDCAINRSCHEASSTEPRSSSDRKGDTLAKHRPVH
jgi:hypothetical protein